MRDGIDTNATPEPLSHYALSQTNHLAYVMSMSMLASTFCKQRIHQLAQFLQDSSFLEILKLWQVNLLANNALLQFVRKLARTTVICIVHACMLCDKLRFSSSEEFCDEHGCCKNGSIITGMDVLLMYACIYVSHTHA